MANNLPEIISMQEDRREKSVTAVTPGQKDFPTDHLGKFVGQNVHVKHVVMGSMAPLNGTLERVDNNHFMLRDRGVSHPFSYKTPGHVRVYADLKDQYGEPFDIKVDRVWVPAREKIYDNEQSP